MEMFLPAPILEVLRQAEYAGSADKVKHAFRRRATLRVALRRRRRHLRLVHPEFLADPSPGNADCVCEFAPWFFASHSDYACRCVRSEHGNPKYGRGSCHWGKLRTAVAVRVGAKRIVRAVQAGRLAAEDVLPARGNVGYLAWRQPAQ